MPLTDPVQHILVLDDDELMRDLLETLLSIEGYLVTLAQDGNEALLWLRAGAPFDAVLTDLNMPGLEGRDLVEALRSSMPSRGVLIGMSGSAPKPEIRAILDAFLPKPFQVQLLRDAIGNAPKGKNHSEQTTLASEAAHTGTSDMAVEPLDDTIFNSLNKMISSAQLGQLFSMALADIAKRHQRIEVAAGAGDLPSAQREAHAIKGSCGMIGAAEIQSLAAAIEDGPTFNVFAISEIPAACLRLKRMLETKLQTV